MNNSSAPRQPIAGKKDITGPYAGIWQVEGKLLTRPSDDRQLEVRPSEDPAKYRAKWFLWDLTLDRFVSSIYKGAEFEARLIRYRIVRRRGNGTVEIVAVRRVTPRRRARS